MDFYAVLDQAIALLRQRSRVTYRALKLQFQLDNDALEVLKDELIKAQRLAVDENGEVLVWTGDAASAPASPPATTPDQAPLAYTPPHLTEKILASRSAMEGEGKQVTVLFADIKDSTELIRDLDPEAAQQLLDPAIHRMMDAVHRYEGTVNQVLGDGIMALFGAPLAHEGHALRACYAALAMQAAIRPYTEEVRRAHADSPDIAQAEAHYQQALAETLGMRPLVAHCHLGLGRLYGQTGRGVQTRAALATAIDLCHAMDMTFWLLQAEAALAQVA